jgi:hypothetical protein
VGAFPSIRCDDRSLYNARKPCPEIGGDRPQLHERYLVAVSRQAYGYGVAFHLTGNPVYLTEMKAGIDFIRQNAIDRTNGGNGHRSKSSERQLGPCAEASHPATIGLRITGPVVLLLSDP